MIGKDEERWKQLCQQVVNEKDPEKILELTAEIDRLLAEKEQRLRAIRAPDKKSG